MKRRHPWRSSHPSRPPRSKRDTFRAGGQRQRMVKITRRSDPVPAAPAVPAQHERHEPGRAPVEELRLERQVVEGRGGIGLAEDATRYLVAEPGADRHARAEAVAERE